MMIAMTNTTEPATPASPDLCSSSIYSSSYSSSSSSAVPSAPPSFPLAPYAPLIGQQPPQPQPQLQNNNTNMFTAVIPPDYKPGQRFPVVSPTGRVIEVTVPEGVSQGQQIRVSY
jgi:hypothetical protein